MKKVFWLGRFVSEATVKNWNPRLSKSNANVCHSRGGNEMFCTFFNALGNGRKVWILA